MVSLIKLFHALSSFSCWHSYEEDDMSMDGIHWINSIILSLTIINTDYPNGLLFNFIHAISPFTYFHSYVEADISMDALDWINSSILPLTRINKKLS